MQQSREQGRNRVWRGTRFVLAIGIARQKAESWNLAPSLYHPRMRTPHHHTLPESQGNLQQPELKYTLQSHNDRDRDIEARQLKLEGQYYWKENSHTQHWPTPIHYIPTQSG